MSAFTLWLVFALAVLAGYFWRLWRRERRWRLARNTWGAASHDRWALSDAILRDRVETRRATMVEVARLLDAAIAGRDYGDQPVVWDQVWRDILAARSLLG